MAHSQWAGASLPTQAEWEFAARGGLDGAAFTWGNDDPQDTAPLVNTWQGAFPWENRTVDGWIRTSPVGSFPPNVYGLYDMAGNVWERTDDWYTDRPDDSVSPCCVARNPQRRPGGGELRSDATADPNSAKSPQRRVASLRAELLSPLSSGGPAAADGRHRLGPSRVLLHRSPGEGPRGSGLSRPGSPARTARLAPFLRDVRRVTSRSGLTVRYDRVRSERPAW
jgi:hypothetical protein